ncbi:hypothetical protein [Streptococcus halotolerans]|uniref:hypothetical protein n=1 Tax=Streptococcus halotolerans TaxID=1814128 RepID=UPI000787A567|nr:hypothetical protein [Streptococcus halotolerans]
MSKVTSIHKKNNTPRSTEEIRREVKQKNNLFNRYMLFRYSLALFFFANIYWSLTLFFKPNLYLVIPLALLVILIMATVEQFKLYGASVPKLSRTELALKVQLVTNLLVIALTVFNQTSVLFPTFTNQLPAKLMIVILQVLGVLLVNLNLNRITLIKQNKDKYYQRFQNIEKYI